DTTVSGDWSSDVCSSDLEVSDRALTGVGRDLEHSEFVTSSHHHWSAARQPIIEHGWVIDREAANFPVVEEYVLVVRLRLRVCPVSVVVELLLRSDEPGYLPIPRSRRHPLTADVRVHPLVVGAAQEREIVHLEAGAAPVLRRLPQPEPIVLGD